MSSQLERAAILREKAKQIRQKRDIEQSAFVQEKLEQKWRSENDELRSFMSKQMQAGMKDVHMRQIEEKIALEQNRLVIKKSQNMKNQKIIKNLKSI